MSTLFFFCALIGGTFLACQLVMTMIGIGHGGFDMEMAHGSVDSLAGHIDNPLYAGGNDDGNAAHHHGSSWLFGILSLRTLVAATTIFGLAGMTAHSSGISLVQQLLIAIASGGLAMFAVHWLLRFLHQLGQSGTLRITNAIGKTATVAISIPGNCIGKGKVRLTVQGRLEELAAVNSMGETLLPGSQVVVVDIVSGNVLEVAPLDKAG